jgi:hypothetical protein
MVISMVQGLQLRIANINDNQYLAEKKIEKILVLKGEV